jgi:hypothetical protein
LTYDDWKTTEPDDHPSGEDRSDPDRDMRDNRDDEDDDHDEDDHDDDEMDRAERYGWGV